jgi:hypothetical protein
LEKYKDHIIAKRDCAKITRRSCRGFINNDTKNKYQQRRYDLEDIFQEIKALSELYKRKLYYL